MISELILFLIFNLITTFTIYLNGSSLINLEHNFIPCFGQNLILINDV